MAEIPHLRLKLSSRAENVMVVRQALNGVASTIGLDPVAGNDVNTAVTEACNNVVVHAYGSDEGALEVDVYARRADLEVVVRDQGSGARTQAGQEPEASTGGIGMHVIQALSERVEFDDSGRGTEVRMQFATPRARELAPARADATPPAGAAGGDTVEIALAPGVLAKAVLPRVLTVLATRAFFSTDRIADLELLSDALVRDAESSLDGARLGLAITPAPRSLSLEVGPLPAGTADELVGGHARNGLADLLERLADRREVNRAGGFETLQLGLRDENR